MSSDTRRASSERSAASRRVSGVSARIEGAIGAKMDSETIRPGSRGSSHSSQGSSSSGRSQSPIPLVRQPGAPRQALTQHAKTPIVVVIRHAQAMHNVPPKDLNIPDPPLTKLGQIQASSVVNVYPALFNLVKARSAVVISSPFVRTLQTTHLAFSFLKPEEVWKSADLQEVGDQPANTGSPVRRILEVMGTPHGAQHFTDFKETWFHKIGEYGNGHETVVLRAERIRQTVRKLSAEVVVLVSHGGFMPFLCEDRPWKSGDKWANVQAKVFRFASDKEDKALFVPLSNKESLRVLGSSEAVLPRTL